MSSMVSTPKLYVLHFKREADDPVSTSYALWYENSKDTLSNVPVVYKFN